jgi:hypothetical protein
VENNVFITGRPDKFREILLMALSEQPDYAKIAQTSIECPSVSIAYIHFNLRTQPDSIQCGRIAVAVFTIYSSPTSAAAVRPTVQFSSDR